MLAPYPQIVEYNEAVQHPETAFRDPELRQGQVQINALGLPVAFSGVFALTYRMATRRRDLAVRCFHREIPAAQHKYAAIARTLDALRSPYFVGFDYLPDGIRIRGGFYPVVRMDWADGEPLGIWLDRNIGDRRALERLRQEFATLAAFLERHGIAHGDIQNGNVIVTRKGLKLVDYDGVYVPGMPPDFGCETGHRHFQHPARTPLHFGPRIDRFSFIAIDLSLAALIEQPDLYPRFCQGGETILFRAGDFADPDRSEIFAILQQSTLRDAAGNFAAICKSGIDAVPLLDEFRAGRSIPRLAPSTVAAQVGASNRHLVARLLGDSRAAAAALPVAPRSRVGNREVLRALRSAPASMPTPGSSPPAVPLRQRTAAPPTVQKASPLPRRRPIPKSGSFVIHPRRAATTVQPPVPAEPVREPSVLQRVLRFIGFDA